MKSYAVLVVLVLGAALATDDVEAASMCPPDGDDSSWPTFELAEKCGSYDDCAALLASGRTDDAVACNRKIDACGETLSKANEKADAHNAKLEDCRAPIWSTVVKPAADQ